MQSKPPPKINNADELCVCVRCVCEQFLEFHFTYPTTTAPQSPFDASVLKMKIQPSFIVHQQPTPPCDHVLMIKTTYFFTVIDPSTTSTTPSTPLAPCIPTKCNASRNASKLLFHGIDDGDDANDHVSRPLAASWKRGMKRGGLKVKHANWRSHW